MYVIGSSHIRTVPVNFRVIPACEPVCAALPGVRKYQLMSSDYTMP